MNVIERNRLLSIGKLETPGLFPNLEELGRAPFVFSVDIGLDRLPEEPGVILVRGPRQYGKSTWLDRQLRESVLEHGPGSAFILNGDEIRDEDQLVEAISELVVMFDPRARCHRLFIDEITAVKNWEKGLKRLIDMDDLRSVLVVTTGSKATDLRRGAERLPGRKGKLDRTSYLFPPVSFGEFRRVCGATLGPSCLEAYLLSGGCPIACGELAARGRLPEYVPQMIRDWINGECAASGRDRASLVALMECVTRWGAVPVGQSKIAREAGLANNTVAAGYLELLQDLLCLATSFSWDPSRRVHVRRKPAKFLFVNLLAAVSWDPARLRSVSDYRVLPAAQQGKWLEWLAAQELWRRAALRGDECPEVMAHWQSRDHEIDFVLPGGVFVEVKRGRTSPLDFAWFPRVFPGGRLIVVGQGRFETRWARGVTFEEFLMEPDSSV